MTQQLDDGAPWDALAAAWQRRDEHPRVDPQLLRAQVQRETTRMQRWLGIEIAFSVAVVAMTFYILVRHADPRALLLAIDSWVVLVIVWLFALWGRRGLWKPSAESTEAYIVLGRRRARLKLQTAWLAFGLLVAQLVVGQATAERSTLHWIVAAAWLVWAFWMRRRAIDECRRLDALLAELRRG